MRSIMWLLPLMVAVAELDSVFAVQYQSCMHGGCRDKRQQLLTNLPGAAKMGAMCDHSHTHKI